jgi:hypothetical protein
MTEKSSQVLDAMDDLRIDYLLIAAGLAAALIALAYLLIA